MNRLEVAELFREIKYHYANFDTSAERIISWHKHLEKAGKEPVYRNLEYHIANREFPPTVAELLRLIDPNQEYHDSLKEAAARHFDNLDTWRDKAVPPPEKLRELVRGLAAKRDGRNQATAEHRS